MFITGCIYFMLYTSKVPEYKISFFFNFRISNHVNLLDNQTSLDQLIISIRHRYVCIEIYRVGRG